MQKIIPFDYQGKAIRVLSDNSGEPWWVVVDVCKVLGIGNTSAAVQRLDDDEKTQVIDPNIPHHMRGTGINELVNVVNESGLYQLIFASRKQEAKTFRRWIVHEVLPQIRKTGSYATPEVERFGKGIQETPVLKLPKSVTWNKVATSHRAFLKIAEDMGFTGEDRLKLAQQAVFRAYHVDVRNLFKPEVEKAEKGIETPKEPVQITMRGPKKRSMVITETSQNDAEDAKMETEVPMDAHLRVTDLGRILGGIQARKMNQILEQEGYQMALREKDGIEWCVTQKGSPFAIKKYVPKSNGIGGSVLQTFWKASIIKELQKVIIEKKN